MGRRRLEFRVSDEQAASIAKAAKAAGLPVASWIRQVVLAVVKLPVHERYIKEWSSDTPRGSSSP